ncbi:RRM_1 domain-containing protein/RRM_6 domain-containing protein, partial [Cephalotus follicularis]
KRHSFLFHKTEKTTQVIYRFFKTLIKFFISLKNLFNFICISILIDMRTRNPDATKSTPAAKKAPPASRKSAVKTAFDSSAAESATPKTAETKRVSAAKSKPAKNNEATPSPISDSKPEQSPVEEVKASTDAVVGKPEAKVVLPAKSAGKRMVVRTRGPSARAIAKRKAKGEVVSVEAKGLESVNKDEAAVKNDKQSGKKEESALQEEEDPVEEFEEEEETAIQDVVESVIEVEQIAMEVGVPPSENFEGANQVEPVGSEAANILDNEGTGDSKMEEKMNEEPKNGKESKIEPIMVVENSKMELQGEDAKREEEEYGGDEGLEEYGDRVDFGDHDDDELAEEDPEEPAEETETLEEEHRELTAAAKERRIKKEHEIFVGGLDRDAREEDVREVFEKIGEVNEVRLHINFATNKNKGYAFVKFANKEHAKRALLEMKNPLICGKRCGTAPSEDNDSLFLGNICNTWTKEAIRQKLKEYGVEGVENITLVSDVQHEGRSRGFAFLDFSCHHDAMLAYKRLQKPDVVFGHLERTAKVAFAEPLREPDPEIMAQVKTVFLDGLAPHWDEDHVREQLKGFGEIVRVVLARNMSTAKRKDFGFVDFSTHDAAVACINGINDTELGGGNSKTKVKARLSNPLPKTQAVKGGMCGGFRIGRGGSGTFPRFGRGFGRGGHQFNWPNFQRGRGFYQRGHGQTGRMGMNDFDNHYAEFHGRQFFGRGGRRGSFRGGHHAPGRGVAAAGPSRPNFSRFWHDLPNRGRGEHVSSRRQPFSPEEAYERPFVGRHFADPYYYEDGPHGMKRPFYMTGHDPDYVEPSRPHPRLDYTDSAGSFRGSRYNDSYGDDGGLYSHDYYGSDYGGYPSYYGGDRPYGGGFYH